MDFIPPPPPYTPAQLARMKLAPGNSHVDLPQTVTLEKKRSERVVEDDILGAALARADQLMCTLPPNFYIVYTSVIEALKADVALRLEKASNEANAFLSTEISRVLKSERELHKEELEKARSVVYQNSLKPSHIPALQALEEANSTARKYPGEPNDRRGSFVSLEVVNSQVLAQVGKASSKISSERRIVVASKVEDTLREELQLLKRSVKAGEELAAITSAAESAKLVTSVQAAAAAEAERDQLRIRIGILEKQVAEVQGPASRMGSMGTENLKQNSSFSLVAQRYGQLEFEIDEQTKEENSQLRSELATARSEAVAYKKALEHALAVSTETSGPTSPNSPGSPSSAFNGNGKGRPQAVALSAAAAAKAKAAGLKMASTLAASAKASSNGGGAKRDPTPFAAAQSPSFKASANPSSSGSGSRYQWSDDSVR